MDTTSQRVLTAKGHEILFNLERKPVKNLNLRVRKDGSVWVSADPGVPCEEIDAFVASKAPYIQKALDHFHELAQYRPQPRHSTFWVAVCACRSHRPQRIPFQRTASTSI